MMFNLQAKAIAALGLRSVPRRAGSSASTVLAIALVVLVLLGFISMGNGFRRVLEGTGAEDVAILLREGASSAQGSLITEDQIAQIEAAPGIRRDAGKPDVSPELAVVAAVDRPAGASPVNLALRGIAPESGFLLRDVALVEGRAPRPGSNEIMLGRSVARELPELKVGAGVRLGAMDWRVVGIFAAHGGMFESEARADLHIVQSVFRRGGSVQSIRAALDPTDGLKRLQDYLAKNPQIGLTAQRESAYFETLSRTSGLFVERLGWPLALLMAVGALAGACNTMYTSLDARKGEIVTLRTLGFARSAIFTGLMVEATTLALAGGALGVLIACLIFNGMRSATMASSLGQVSFAFSVSPVQALQALFLAWVIGLLGGILPAVKAARSPLALAGRE